MLTLHINLFAVFDNPSTMFVAPQPGEKKGLFGHLQSHPLVSSNMAGKSLHVTGGYP